MTNPSVSLVELAERCEKASGPDREIDLDIARALKAFDPKHRFAVAPFTGSLDAAMTLVPDGYCVECMGEVPDNPPGAKAWCQLAREIDMSSLGCIDAATLPLALCAASLRARDQGEQ